MRLHLHLADLVALVRLPLNLALASVGVDSLERLPFPLLPAVGILLRLGSLAARGVGFLRRAGVGGRRGKRRGLALDLDRGFRKS